MTRNRYSAAFGRLLLGATLLVSAAALAQFALDAALDANTRVGGTGYNPPNRAGGAQRLSSGSYRLDRRSGEFKDSYGGNSAFSRPEYRANDAIGVTNAVARAGYTRDQYYPAPATTNLRQDDVQRRLAGGAYAPDDRRGRQKGGLQSGVYKPYDATSYANPGNVGYPSAPKSPKGEVTLTPTSPNAVPAPGRAAMPTGRNYWTSGASLGQAEYSPIR